MTASQKITLAHLSDLHMPASGFAPPRYWTIKRSLGYINWQTGRKRSFAMSAINSLIADMQKRAPDHIALTGDLVNFGLPSELKAAADWLKTLGPSHDISVIPGNHDIYVTMHSDPGVARWIDNMQSDDYGRTVPGADNAVPVLGTDIRGGFPYVRRIGNIALIGLNSAIPMPAFIAAGELGADQRARLETVLKHLRQDNLCRVVMIHHPPLTTLGGRRRGLRDAEEFTALLRTHGAELVLHGHNHVNTIVTTDGPDRPIPVVGIAAGGMVRNHKHPGILGRYNLVAIKDAGTPQCEIDLTGYGLETEAGPIIELERRQLCAADANLRAIAGQ